MPLTASPDRTRSDRYECEQNETADLLCCLAGFGSADTAVIRGLVQTSSLHLSANWTFQTKLYGSCDLLICDVDTHAGKQAWHATAGRTLVRVMVTTTPDVSPGLRLRKPIEADGPDGLIRVLNEAARIQSVYAYDNRRTSSSTAAPADASAPVPARWSIRRALHFVHRWLLKSPTKPAAVVQEAKAPLPEVLVAEQPYFAIVVERDGQSEMVPTRAFRQTHPEPPDSDDVSPLVASPALTGQIVPYTPMERLQPQPSRLILHVPGSFSLVPEAVEENLLTALRRFRSLSQVAVIRFDDLPTICVTSATEMFYSLASLQSLYEVPVVKLTPARVTIARNSHQGRTEAQSYYQSGSQSYFVSLPGAPLKHLFWVAILRCGGEEEIDHYEDAFFRVRVSPEFALLPHERHHVTWCNLLVRQPVTLSILAKATGHTKGAAAIFLAACDELGILERKGLNSAGMLAISGGKSAERSTARRLVQHLGFK